MICPNCGRYLEDGVAFCIYCGQRFGKYASGEEPEAAGADVQAPVEEPAAEPAPQATTEMPTVEEEAPEATGESASPQAGHASAFAGDAATAPVAPDNARDVRTEPVNHTPRPSVAGRRRLHSDDEIARRMGSLDEGPSRGRKVAAGIIIAVLVVVIVAFFAIAFGPSLFGGSNQPASSSQAITTATSSTGSSSSSSSLSSSSSSSAKSSSSSASGSSSSSASESSSGSTETKRGSTLERANGDASDSAAAAAEAGTVEAKPTSGNETTTGVVNNPSAATGSTGFTSPKATATSVSPTEGNVSHGPELVLDGRPETAWNTNESGIGQSITISVDSSTSISGLRIMNGYNKISVSGADLYYANARAKKVVVEYEGGSKTFTLKDKKGKYQKLKFKSPVKTSWVKITIKSVYPGDRYDDCCISEIEVI